MIHASPEVRRYAILDSTNEEALRLARTGASGPLWILTREQTAGRGRRGRRWVSRPGNLFATLLLRVPAERSGELAFVAALAVADTVEAFAPSSSVRLKWPNDVLLDGRKVAGMLLERSGAALAIGIGINLAHHPEEMEFPATSLSSLGRSVESDEAFRVLAVRMAAWYEVWSGEGFAAIRTAWVRRASGIGAAVTVRVVNGEQHGVFEDLDADGALLLRSGGAVARVTAGDVFFGE